MEGTIDILVLSDRGRSDSESETSASGLGIAVVIIGGTLHRDKKIILIKINYSNNKTAVEITDTDKTKKLRIYFV